jgi:hypothetical protein
MVAPSGPNLRMFVLDSMQDDIEELASIMAFLCEWRPYWHGEFIESEVLDALCSLAEDGLVVVYEEVSGSSELESVSSPRLDRVSLQEYWFGPTPEGRKLWKEWDAPSLPESN